MTHKNAKCRKQAKSSAARRAQQKQKSTGRKAQAEKDRRTDRQTEPEREREVGGEERQRVQQQQQTRQDARIIKHTRKYDNARFLLKLLQSETRQCQTTNES